MNCFQCWETVSVSHVFTNIPKSSLVVSISLRQKACFPYPAKTHSQMHIPLARILTNMALYCVHDQQKLAQRQLSSPWYISNYKYGNYSRQSIQRNYLDTLNTTHQLCPGDVSSLYLYLSLDTGNEISLWKFLYSLLQNICENVCDSHDQITSEPLPSVFLPLKLTQTHLEEKRSNETHNKKMETCQPKEVNETCNIYRVHPYTIKSISNYRK